MTSRFDIKVFSEERILLFVSDELDEVVLKVMIAKS